MMYILGCGKRAVINEIGWGVAGSCRGCEMLRLCMTELNDEIGDRGLPFETDTINNFGDTE